VGTDRDSAANVSAAKSTLMSRRVHPRAAEIALARKTSARRDRLVAPALARLQEIRAFIALGQAGRRRTPGTRNRLFRR